jgi:hypothetical protein
MGNSKNFLNTSQKTGRHDKMIAVNQVTIVMILVCGFLVTLWRGLNRQIFLEGIFGLVHVLGIARTALAD